METQITLQLEYRRCLECGRVRYGESGFMGDCGHCAWKIIRSLERLERQVRAYKGIFKHKGENAK